MAFGSYAAKTTQASNTFSFSFGDTNSSFQSTQINTQMFSSSTTTQAAISSSTDVLATNGTSPLHLSARKKHSFRRRVPVKYDDQKTTEYQNQSYIPDFNSSFYVPSTFETDLMSMYSDRDFSDVELKMDAESFFAHKVVLSSRSPVFKAMFLSDMKETANNCVDITDLSSETLRQMLLFMYTDTLEDLTWASTKDLYSAADKYDIISLRQRCTQLLQKQLSTSNACEALVFADLHQNSELKKMVQNYIMTHGREIFCSNEWRSFLKENPLMAAEVMHLKVLEVYK
ncbi:TD and POZ domain-containing protein 3 [Caerostris extrusa]|uniref:TD and POZ domain-containing protein 3 n=1 Tax=Caerostris extrusa TaxID=172846 RepID=A0AAV4V402_CAEEX|nr:TD and POZ domain-containing protein 3 [Caerostris extrusa]